MKILILSVITVVMSCPLFANPITPVEPAVVDFNLVNNDDVEENKQSLDVFMDFLAKNHYSAEAVENTNDLQVRVTFDPPNEEKYFWLIEHSQDFPIASIYTSGGTSENVEPVEVDIEKSGSIPLEYVQIILEDKRRLDSLVRNVEKAFEKYTAGVGELEYIMSQDVVNDNGVRKFGITVEVRNSQKNFLLLMKVLADFKADMHVRDIQNPEDVFDIEKYRTMVKKKMPVSYADMIANPNLVATDATTVACESLFIL